MASPRRLRLQPDEFDCDRLGVAAMRPASQSSNTCANATRECPQGGHENRGSRAAEQDNLRRREPGEAEFLPTIRHVSSSQLAHRGDATASADACK